MDVAMTARKGKITKGLREHAEAGMARIGRILGRSTTCSIILNTQRHVHTVELTVQARLLKFAATGKADTPLAALREAMDRAEHQAFRYRDRNLEKKRLPKEDKVVTAPPVTRAKARAPEPAGEETDRKPVRAAKGKTSIAVHSFPSSAAVVEPHIVNSAEAIALKPMTIEEAVKEAEFRDRDLLIFHNPAGEMYVLHRRRDGQMELVEIP
jgi:putative sigma-54 modulation protein